MLQKMKKTKHQRSVESLRSSFKEQDKQLLKLRLSLLQRFNKEKEYQKTGQIDDRPNMRKKRRSTRLQKITEALACRVFQKKSTKIIQNRMKQYVERALGEEQA